jgi:hypothetical protein
MKRRKTALLFEPHQGNWMYTCIYVCMYIHVHVDQQMYMHSFVCGYTVFECMLFSDARKKNIIHGTLDGVTNIEKQTFAVAYVGPIKSCVLGSHAANA